MTGVSRPGISLIEVVIAILIIGSSALPILELIRSSTASLGLSETEVAVRGFAADVLNRFAGPPIVGTDPLVAPATKALLSAPVPADVLMSSDPYLARGVDRALLEPLLKRASCTVKLTIARPTDPALRTQPGLSVFNLTAAWVDPGGRRKEISLAMLVAR